MRPGFVGRLLLWMVGAILILPVAAYSTDVTYMALPGIGETGDRIIWYQRRRRACRR